MGDREGLKECPKKVKNSTLIFQRLFKNIVFRSVSLVIKDGDSVTNESARANKQTPPSAFIGLKEEGEGGGIIDLSSYPVIEIILPLIRTRIFSELQSVSSQLCKCMLIVEMVTLRKKLAIKMLNF